MGSPRIATDQLGNVIARHDYMAFGEEIYAGTSNRSTNDHYNSADNVRQQFTGYERDLESGLDYAQARYYNSAHGRFTSVDPLTASATIKDPQTFNRYSYALNSPYKFTDPLGLIAIGETSACGNRCQNSDGGVDGSAFHGRDTSFPFDEPETITLNLNIVYNTAQGLSESGARKELKETIQDLQDTMGQINVQFNVTYTAGTANESVTRITSGAIEGAINAFYFDNTKNGRQSGSYYQVDTKQIFLGKVSGWRFDKGSLAHEMGHLFRQFVNGSPLSGRQVAGEKKAGGATVDANNQAEDDIINAANDNMRIGAVGYVDDYRTVKERTYKPTLSKLGPKAAAGGFENRVPSPFDIYRLGARMIANQQR